jgi:cellulose synthase/poly-beta-1,6-N-acetylglucosamine synthase-like glycosyltransferase
MAILSFVILLFVCYSILILYYWQSWKVIPEFKASLPATDVTISVIIPARNEKENIVLLLKALQQQNYPEHLTEIIVVDDHSTDGTAGVVQQFYFAKLILLKEDNINSYKKKSIETGIAAAKGDLIVTTDADCIPGPGWLSALAAFKQEKDSVFIAAPVVFVNNNSILQIFQALDFLVLQGITAASVYKRIHSMCNGANLAYEKKAFGSVNGFSGIDTIASGDDMLLMHKIATLYPQQVHYLKSKDAIVATESMKTWKEFFNQRIRWASKAKYYDDNRIVAVLLLVYLFNFSFLVLWVAGFWCYHYWLYFTGLWIAKTIIEWPFVSSVAGFFNKKSLMKYFFFFQPLHILYTIFSGLLGQFGKYEWKGRKVK